MKKSILKKVAFKEKTFDLYKRLIAQNYLISKSINFINKRNNHLAVFANDFIGIDIFLNGTYEKKEYVYISTNNKNIVPVKNHSLIICLPLKHHEILLTK